MRVYVCWILSREFGYPVWNGRIKSRLIPRKHGNIEEKCQEKRESADISETMYWIVVLHWYIQTVHKNCYVTWLHLFIDRGRAVGGFRRTSFTPGCCTHELLCNMATLVYWQGDSSGGISEDQFYSWLLREPQTLVWIPTLHRLAASETGTGSTNCSKSIHFWCVHWNSLSDKNLVKIHYISFKSCFFYFQLSMSLSATSVKPTL